MIAEVEQKQSALEFIQRAVYGYLDARLEERWGKYGGGVRFTDSGKARISQIFGWIVGLSANEQTLPFAEQAAEDIASRLDWLAQYGGEVEDGHRGNKPKYLVQLHDDGTFGGFSVLWFVARTPEEQEGIAEDKFRKEFDDTFAYGAKVRYVFSFNGGLLYHGPGHGDTFAVTLGSSHLWSIHT